MSSRIGVLTATICLAATLATSPPTIAAPAWAPAHAAAIHPGVRTITADQAQCTSNFIFHDRSAIYLGQAAHCSLAGDPLAASDPASPDGPDGCSTPSLPLGTPVSIEGATRPGTLVYSSWITMQEIGESDENACSFNDFALVKIDPADHKLVNPTMPHWGGPTGLATSTTPGEQVLSYGSSELRSGLNMLNPKEGISRGQSAGGWNHTVLTITPGVPGDSGSGFVDSEGKAFGVLSTLIVLPQAGHNGVADLSRALAYMEAHTGLDGVALAPGTEPFKADSPLEGALPLLTPVLDLLEVPLGLLAELLEGLPVP